MARGTWKYTLSTPVAEVLADIPWVRGEMPSLVPALQSPDSVRSILQAARYLIRHRSDHGDKLDEATNQSESWAVCSEIFNDSTVIFREGSEPAPKPAKEAPGNREAPGNAGDDVAALAEIIRRLSAGNAAAPLDVDAVRAIVAEELRNLERPRPVQVYLDSPIHVEPADLGLQHFKFETLLRMLSAHAPGNPINIWLVGPAGSGKTRAVQEAAKALDLKFYASGAVDSEYKLTGYMSATGAYVRTAFRDAFEHGGIFLLDEVDGSNPAALLAINSATANDFMAFPDGMVERHVQFRVVCAANTYGLGATAEYVGRTRQDAASLDRFVFLSWPYDTALEAALADNRAWINRVQTLRNNAIRKGMKVVISPRATMQGAQLIKAGLSIQDVEASVIRKSMTDEQWASIQ